MKALEAIIADFDERPLPSFTPRETVLPAIRNKADVVIGMRRSGKTFVLFQEMQRLLDLGVDKERLLYVNFEDDRLEPLHPGLLAETLETYYRMHPEARSEGAFLFFDEVQLVEGWSRFVRRVLDTENARVYLSGSSAKMLSTEVATEMRGRGFAVEVLPFGFAESCRHHGIDVPEKLPGARLRSKLEARFDDYLDIGGFPEVQDADERIRLQLLQDYVELVLLRDVIERHKVTNVYAARSFARTLLAATASPLSVNKVYNDLKSRGVDVGKDLLYALLDHLSDSFLVFGVPLFSKSLRVRQANPRKMYAIDPGLARAMSHVAAKDVGARLETAVYLELRRRIGRARDGVISYYRSRAGHEVDFVLGEPDEERATDLVQVCADLRDAQTRDREIRALSEAMGEIGLRDSTIVTLRQDEVVETDAGLVRLVPAWRWMLGL